MKHQGRIRIGDVFKVTGAPIQPVNIPVNEDAAAVEIAELAEKNSGLLADAEVGRKLAEENSELLADAETGPQSTDG